MENATQALLIAASVLLLIIALTVSISSFTSLKEQVQTWISERTQLETVTDNSGEFLNYLKSSDNAVRLVGPETIMSAIGRIQKENYNIYIIHNNNITGSDDKFLSELDGKNVVKLTTKNNEIDKYLTGEEEKKIFNLIKNKKYNEHIGIYKEKTDQGVLEAEKTTYKILTFVEQ